MPGGDRATCATATGTETTSLDDREHRPARGGRRSAFWQVMDLSMAEVLGRYAKLSTTGVRATKARVAAEQNRRPMPWKSPELRGVTRVRRVLATQIGSMVTDYAAGMGSVQIARKYGVSDSTVLVHLKASGVEIRPPGKLSPDDMAEVRRLRSQGWTHQQLADRFGVSRAAVSLRLRHAVCEADATPS